MSFILIICLLIHLVPTWCVWLACAWHVRIIYACKILNLKGVLISIFTNNCWRVTDDCVKFQLKSATVHQKCNIYKLFICVTFCILFVIYSLLLQLRLSCKNTLILFSIYTFLLSYSNIYVRSETTHRSNSFIRNRRVRSFMKRSAIFARLNSSSFTRVYVNKRISYPLYKYHRHATPRRDYFCFSNRRNAESIMGCGSFLIIYW